MRGPKPQPTKLKLLRGIPGKRPLPKNEPQLEPAMPEPPEVLEGDALKEWNRISPLLHGAGLLTALDGAALAVGCQSYGIYIEATRNIRKSGTVIKSIQGQPMMSPYLKVANVALQQWTRMLAEFGMTPSSRTRIKVPDAPPASDPYTEWRNRRKR
jgi:P27 family predicted phage terminase small subunit